MSTEVYLFHDHIMSHCMAIYNLFKQSLINKHLHFLHLMQYYHEDFYMYTLAYFCIRYILEVAMLTQRVH